ncbi:MAG TPA: hypothetical protein VN648_01015 [Candidatus Methylomirabilis sp.]|nr:hypothetical protein [Candidatus Methylomirabilis sp.]
MVVTAEPPPPLLAWLAEAEAWVRLALLRVLVVRQLWPRLVRLVQPVWPRHRGQL